MARIDTHTPVFQARLREAARAGITRALQTLPPDAATITWDADNSLWGVEITPRTPGAAKVVVVPGGGDEVVVQAGDTRFISFGDLDDITRDLDELLTAIFQGRYESASVGNAARVTTPHGVVKVGDRSTMPLPWAWRRPHGYAAYA